MPKRVLYVWKITKKVSARIINAIVWMKNIICFFVFLYYCWPSYLTLNLYDVPTCILDLLKCVCNWLNYCLLNERHTYLMWSWRLASLKWRIMLIYHLKEILHLFLLLYSINVKSTVFIQIFQMAYLWKIPVLKYSYL